MKCEKAAERGLGDDNVATRKRWERYLEGRDGCVQLNRGAAYLTADL